MGMTAHEQWLKEERQDRHRGYRLPAAPPKGPRRVCGASTPILPSCARSRSADYFAVYIAARRRVDAAFRAVLHVRQFFTYCMRAKVLRPKTEARFVELTGLTPYELYLRLWSQMPEGMTWQNRHLWHIDHERPCCAFDFRDEKQARECFHFTNLRPAWAKDNMAKVRTDLQQRIARKHATGGRN